MRRRKVFACVQGYSLRCSLLICMGMGIAAAQAPELPDDFPVLVENAPDSGPGFAMLRKRMQALPGGAVPVKVVSDHGEWNHHQEPAIPNTWKLPGDGETQTLVFYTGNREGSVRSVKQTRGRGYNFNFDPGEVDFVVEELDTAENVKALFTFLMATDEDGEWRRRSLLNQYGELMLYAARLHEAGYPDQANQLAAYLFEKQTKRATVMRALSTLADYAYQDLLKTFMREGDVPVFVNGAKALWEEHRAVWAVAPVLQEKLTEWEQTLNLPADALPESADERLGEEMKALYRRLVADPEALSMLIDFLEGENWLLQPNALLQEMSTYYFDEEELKDSPALTAFEALKKSRSDIFKLAEVMLADRRLLPYSDPYGGMMIQYHRQDQPPSLPQPMTVSGFGLQLLSGLAPGDEDWDMEDPAELSRVLENFNAVTGEMNRMQLARFYLDRRGEYNLPEEAVYTLLSSEDAGVRKQVSDLLLQDERHLPHAVSIFKDFRNFRKEEAEAGLKLALERLRVMDPERAWSFGGPDGLKREIAEVEKMLGEEPEVETEVPEFAVALDAWIAAGDPDNSPGMQTVLSSGQTVDPVEIQRVIADRIQKSSMEAAQTLIRLQNMVIQSGGLSELQSRMHRRDREMMHYYVQADEEVEAADEPEVEAETVSESAWEKDIWLPVLKARETTGQKLTAYSLAYTLMMPLIEEQGDYAELVAFAGLLGGPDDPANLKLVAWAENLLENPEDMRWVREFPSADKVPEERKTQMRDILSGDDIAAARELLDTDNLNERLAMDALCAEEAVQENQKLWESRRERRNAISYTFSSVDQDPLFAETQAGDVLTLEKIDSLLAGIQAEARKGENGIFHIKRLPYDQGMVLHHNRDFLSSGYFREKKIRMYGLNSFNRISGEFTLETPLKLRAPAEGEKKQLSILDLVEAKEDQQLESIGGALHEWLNTPLPPGEAPGQFTVIYCGKTPNDNPNGILEASE